MPFVANSIKKRNLSSSDCRLGRFASNNDPTHTCQSIAKCLKRCQIRRCLNACAPQAAHVPATTISASMEASRPKMAAASFIKTTLPKPILTATGIFLLE